MQLTVRTFFYLILFLLILSVERVAGLPFFSLTLSLLYLSSLPFLYKEISWILVGFFLGVFYSLPFAMSFVIVLSLLFLIEHPFKFMVRQSVTLWVSIVLCNLLIALQLHFHPSVMNLLYHCVAAALNLLLIRYMLYKKTGQRNLSISRKIM
jgi:hypothetical protein